MEQTFQPQQNTPFSPLPTATPQKRPPFVLIAVLIVIAAVVTFAIIRLNSSKSTEKASQEISSVTPTEFQFPTETPTPVVEEESPTPTSSTSPRSVQASTPTVNPVDKVSGLDRSVLTVTVQNGSGETGAASKASDALKGFGYRVTSIGNAANFDYENLTIQVKSTEGKFLPLLKKDLGLSYTVGSASADLSSSFSTDALVIVGK